MDNSRHKIWIELTAKKETPGGAIPIDTSIGIIKGICKIGDKYKFDGRIIGLPKEVINYEPTNKTIQINKLSDIVEKLTPEQFEMFIIDLRQWVQAGREYKGMCDNKEAIDELTSSIGFTVKINENWKKFKKGMVWIDSGEHKVITKVEIES